MTTNRRFTPEETRRALEDSRTKAELLLALEAAVRERDHHALTVHQWSARAEAAESLNVELVEALERISAWRHFRHTGEVRDFAEQAARKGKRLAAL